MDEKEHGGVPGLHDPARPPVPASQVKRDVWSRDALELLKLGEAIVDLRADQRSLRLEKEELRFERDRLRSAVGELQSKLTVTLADLDQALREREAMDDLRREIEKIAREYEARLEEERAEVAAVALEFEQKLQLHKAENRGDARREDVRVRP
ncbi:hypothetical protein Q4F19_04670 [Sphingomonas sp. BIUV-7]|uniref:Uncharacterized protein n=1 Tax=Sphingomonas natans TaxID=3063330 RepID=A0ABT8Y7E9_9SPHN|nr:hypothetical protein [Sphingomonas sp. BIUV-7]MDO6413669.1 hypothetical protein [Sphingomonas sp. BIUV-7]